MDQKDILNRKALFASSNNTSRKHLYLNLKPQTHSLAKFERKKGKESLSLQRRTDMLVQVTIYHYDILSGALDVHTFTITDIVNDLILLEFPQQLLNVQQ